MNLTFHLSIIPLFFILSLASSVEATVGVYKFHDCVGQWKKENRGFYDSVLDTLAESGSRRVDKSMNDFSAEISEATLKVYETYRMVLAKKGKAPDYIESFLADLKSEDQKVDKKRLTYFIYRNEGLVEGVVRVLVSHGSDPDFLLPERAQAIGLRIRLAVTQNRVVISRLVALPRPGKTPIAKELTYTVATALWNFFGSKPFEIFAATSRSRARLYTHSYHFHELASPVETEIDDFWVVGISGSTFIDMYIGHIHRAYFIGIKERRVNDALELLKHYELTYGLADYGPTQHAKRHLQMIAAVFDGVELGTGVLYQQILAGEKSEANIDFEIIFYARSLYCLLTYHGNARSASQALERHIESLTKLGLADAKRMAHLWKIAPLFAAHGGDPSQITKQRRMYAQLFFESDVAHFEEFIRDYNFYVSQRSLANLNQDQFRALIKTKQKFLDPAFNSFVESTNPLIFQFLSLIYKNAGHVKSATLLESLGLDTVFAEEQQGYKSYFRKFINDHQGQ